MPIDGVSLAPLQSRGHVGTLVDDIGDVAEGGGVDYLVHQLPVVAGAVRVPDQFGPGRLLEVA